MSFSVGGFAGAGAQQVTSIIGGTAAQPGLDGLLQELWKISPSRIPDLNTLIITYRRGIITKDNLYEFALRNGWRKENVDQMLQAAEVLPGVADEVRFVVKEAYSPELIKDLIADEEVPPKFIEALLKLGVPPHKAALYWPAHYDPLGRGEFEEMFHRLSPDQLKFKAEELKELKLEEKDVTFSLEFLKRMYRLRDVYPGLRPRLAMISYKPIARIDIRRLEDFDIVEPEQLEFLNREIGYSPKSAKLISLWSQMASVMRDIIPQLKSGDMNYDDAIKELVNVGATLEGATKLINRKKHFIKRDKLKAEKDIVKSDILNAYKIGLFDTEEAKQGLIALNYDEEEAKFLLDIQDFKKDLENKTKKSKEKNLSKADILKGLKEELISENDAKDQLVSIGYDEEESEFLITIALIKKKPKEKPVKIIDKKLSKADITKAFKEDVITRDQAHDRLLVVGFDEEEAEFILETEQVKKDKKA